MSTELSRVESRKASRNRKKKPKRKLKGGVKTFLRFLLIVAVFFGVVFLSFRFGDKMFERFVDASLVPDKEVAAETKTNENGEEVAVSSSVAEGPVNILLIGTDQRKNEPARSDTLMLATLFPDKKVVRVLSIPRDTKVRVEKHGTTKITHAHAYGGVDLTRKTVEDFLGINVDYYIKTNFKGFEEIIDTLGGITIEVEKRMYKPSEGINLKPGLQELNGHDALAYVRFRSDGLGDIGRIKRQDKFLSALADHAVNISTVWKIPELIKKVQESVSTDLGIKDIIYFATKYKDIDSSKISTQMLEGAGVYEKGVSYWEADLNKLEETIEDMQKKPKDEPENPVDGSDSENKDEEDSEKD